MLRFFSYSFTASDGSEESTAGRAESPCSIMMHHCFRSKDVRKKESKNIVYVKQHHTPQKLVASQDDVSRKLSEAFLLVDSFNFNFVDDEHSDI